MGSVRGVVLAIDSDDDVLAWVGAIGMAIVHPAALIIDNRFSPAPGSRSVADLIQAGPRLDELSPGRRGVATIPGGDIDESDLEACVSRLTRSWPAVVVRGAAGWLPSVPYRPVYPGLLGSKDKSVAVWQPSIGVSPTELRGPVLPKLGRRSVMAMLAGQRPAARKWIASWKSVWTLPWA